MLWRPSLCLPRGSYAGINYLYSRWVPASKETKVDNLVRTAILNWKFWKQSDQRTFLWLIVIIYVINGNQRSPITDQASVAAPAVHVMFHIDHGDERACFPFRFVSRLT
jgi:hypothetical protein